jgi:hypothetical protein
MFPQAIHDAPRDKAGGFAALYLALAYVAAMPFFLLVVDYQQATTAAEKVTSIAHNYQIMYAMYLVSYVFLGVVLAVLVLSLFEHLRRGGELLARVATVVGLTWSVALILSGMIFNYGMGTVVSLAETSPERAALAWQPIESIAEGLGGAGGETLGGLWLLLVSWAALLGRDWPKALSWFGLAIGVIGVASAVPVLHAGVYVFGLLQILWFAWLGIVLLAHGASAPRTLEHQQALSEV